MKYIKKYEYDKQNYEYENLHHQLNELFTYFRENIPYLKNIWFTFTYDNYLEFNIIWFYSYKTTNLILKPNEYYITLYKITEDPKNNEILNVTNYIENEISNEYSKDIFNIIKKTCLNLNIYQDYKLYQNLKALIKNNLIILDYDKFLIEFEENLKEIASEELYNLIDNFYIILNKADNTKRKEVENKLKNKYKYITHSLKYNL